ncbi:hypothetical protein [Mesorhizobium sp.]|uniref:hypothetical protein n=1 Tax=Mesorhizobium sp. TaxID=1871066 RepID=UPI00257F626B|nr:hypothetical protein [Mesorhizobium sp.]
MAHALAGLRLAASPSSGTIGTAGKHGASADDAPAEIDAGQAEIVIDDMVIRTAVDLEHLPQVIRAVRASR